MKRTRKNPLRKDPSRTALLRRQFSADLQRRFNRVRKDVWRLLVTEDALGRQRPAANAPTFKFDTDAEKVRKFNAWLRKQIDDGILQIDPVSGEPKTGKPWLAKYIDSSYKKGVLRSYIETHAEELGRPQAYYQGTKAQFLETSFGQSERTGKLKLLYTRAYENLKGVTATMGAQMSRTLADGVSHGYGPQKIARQLSKTVSGLTRTRARVIAQTEVMHAHAEGQLDAMDDLGVEHVGAEVEFTTSDDDAVCPRCQALQGKVYTIAEARGVIPVHPRCRCAWTPVIS